MTKQEEIREGIDRDIEFVLMAAYYAGQTGESISETTDKCKSYLKEALHSQGVVIKVDRELPQHLKMMWCHSSKDMKFEEFALEDSFRKAGYVAVEPLVEVCEHDWIKLRNKAITSGEICTKCKAIRPESVEPLIKEK